LEQNYPNPFNGSTIIRYDIPDIAVTETKTSIQIFNTLGQTVKTLVNAPQDPGPHHVMWDATNNNGERVGTGVYFYRLVTNSFVSTKKMIYVK
jgi:flagellar hook assembly protein FlgD